MMIDDLWVLYELATRVNEFIFGLSLFSSTENEMKYESNFRMEMNGNKHGKQWWCTITFCQWIFFLFIFFFASSKWCVLEWIFLHKSEITLKVKIYLKLIFRPAVNCIYNTEFWTKEGEVCSVFEFAGILWSVVMFFATVFWQSGSGSTLGRMHIGNGCRATAAMWANRQAITIQAFIWSVYARCRMPIVFGHWWITLVRTRFYHILQLLTICIVWLRVCVVEMTHRNFRIHFIIAVSIERMMVGGFGFLTRRIVVWAIWWYGAAICFMRPIQFVNAVAGVHVV